MDLLNVLAVGNECILGNDWSLWRHAGQALDLILGHSSLPDDELELWGWVRNPLPPASEGRDFEVIRRSLRLPESAAVASGSDWEKLGAPDKARIHRMARDFAQQHNPLIRHIVRRTRGYLESTIDPETGEPYLKPVAVELFGESDEEAIRLPPYLRDAYSLAGEFCQLLAARVKGSGFLKTLLLRRVGSTIYAGRNTAEDLLGSWQQIAEGEDDDEESLEVETFRSLTPAERAKLLASVDALEANQERDPQYDVVRDTLVSKGWLDAGCIIFSQYFDSVWWLANQLSQDMPQEIIGIYAGGPRSGVLVGGAFSRKARDELKQMVRRGELRLLLGTDAASEGLNLQRLGTLMNLDLPGILRAWSNVKVAFNVSVNFATESSSITCGIKTLLRIECTSYSPTGCQGSSNSSVSFLTCSKMYGSMRLSVEFSPFRWAGYPA